MSRSSRSPRKVRTRSYKLRLDQLEQRLPPGDALLGLLIAWPELDVNHPTSAPIAPRHRVHQPLTASSTNDELTTPGSQALPGNPLPRGSASLGDRTLQRIVTHDTDSDATDARVPFNVQPPISSLDSASRTLGGASIAVRSQAEPGNEVRMAPVSQASLPSRTQSPHGDQRLQSSVSSPPVVTGGRALPPTNRKEGTGKELAATDYGNLPLTFEANHGQTDSHVDFFTRTSGGTVFLTPTAAVFTVQNSKSRIQNSEYRIRNSEFAPQEREPESGSPYSPLSPGGRGVGGEGDSYGGVAVHMQIVGGSPQARASGVNPQPGIVNYFIGNDPNAWRTNIPIFGRVEYQDVYPGVDLAYYSVPSPLTPLPKGEGGIWFPSPFGRGDGGEGGLEYDFIVSPGANPNVITLNFAGADSIEVDPHGDLIVHTAAGDVVQQKPFTYQELGHERKEVASRYLIDGTQVRFEIGAYDATRPLVIDPLVLGYSTYLGGPEADDIPGKILADADGNAYIAGGTTSLYFPTTPGAFDTTANGGFDAFVAKLNSAGSALVYSTYLGGSGDETSPNLALDEQRNAHVLGSTRSTNFPTTPGSFDTIHNGDADVYALRLNSSGSALEYSTYVGGSGVDYGWDISIGFDGSAYFTGLTVSTGFPTTPGAFDESHNGGNDGYLSKLSADGSALLYSTYLGGSNSDAGHCVTVDSEGFAYVAGITSSTSFPTTIGAFDTGYNGGIYDTFAAKFTSDGSGILYSTYLGGGSTDFGDGGIVLDASGNVYLTGYTRSATFPTTPGVFDATHNGGEDCFVTKLNSSGSDLIFSTFLGGTQDDDCLGIDLTVDGAVLVSGGAESRNFPTTADAFDRTYNGGDEDAFLAKLDAVGASLLYSTYIGARDLDFATSMTIDEGGHAYVAGVTLSANFPTTPNALKARNRGGKYTGFVTKFNQT